MTTSPDPTLPVRRTTRSRGLVLSAGLLAAGFLALSFPIDAGGPHGGGSAPSRGSSGGHSYSGGGRSSSGGSRSSSSAPRSSSGSRSSSAGSRSSSSGSRSYVGGRSSSTGWRSWSSSTKSSAPTRSVSGDRGYGSVGTQSSSGPRTFTGAGSRGGSGGPPPAGGNPGGGHPGGGNPGGPPSGGGHPGGGGGHHGGGYHGGGHHGWYCPPAYYAGSSWFWGGPWDWWWGWGWGGGWGWGWGPYGYGGGVYVINEGEPAPNRYARIDTDVSPESTEVYLDGTYIGSADDFDGFPDFLYLETGRYKLEFRHPYYETIVKELDVRPGQGISIDDEMKLLPGKKRLEVVDPEDHGTPLGRVFGKPEANAVAQGPDRTGRFEAEGAMDSGSATGIEAQDVDVLPPATPAAEAGTAPPPAEIAPAERGRLRFEVEPDDAAVYLDDRYVGTAEELADLRRGLAVKPGKHTVTVVRPGYATKTIDVESKPGAAIDVVIELEK